jgi:di/tricarboxylate transporter
LAEYQIWIVFAILISGITLFILQRIRYDIVAALMLLAVGLAGILSFEELFSGFASPAVITVAAALVIAKGLENSGLLDRVEEYLLRFESRPMLPFLLLLTMVAIVSGFINNIAALAITLPIALSLSHRLKLEPSKMLIPLAYASVIGGSITLIGTPSNILIGTIAREELGRQLDIFEFIPVGLPLIVVFLAVFLIMGKYVLPKRTTPYAGERFELPKYITELTVTEKSKFSGNSIGQLEKEYDWTIDVVRIIRGSRETETPYSNTRIMVGDVLVIRTEAEELENIVKGTGLEIRKKSDEEKEKEKAIEKEKNKEQEKKGKELKVVEVVVLPDSALINKTAKQMYIRDRFNVTLLGIARHGSTITKRVAEIRIKLGDVLLLEAAEADLQNVFEELKCAPLRTRGISLHARAPPVLTLLIAGVSIALSAFNILPIEVGLSIGAVGMLVLRCIDIKEAYNAIQWPILVLIGALIPFGTAMQKTGADRFIAEQISNVGATDPIVALVVIFIVTTLLSNVINNVAAAVFMAPVALQLSEILSISGFPMLMAVAFAAAVPYLTPISHQSNLLVMEAGGYKFTDYIRLGAPLTVVTAIVVLLLVPIFWPFQ